MILAWLPPFAFNVGMTDRTLLGRMDPLPDCSVGMKHVGDNGYHATRKTCTLLLDEQSKEEMELKY